MSFDLNDVPTPCYVCDESLLEQNLRLLDSVQQRTGCKILLALKGFAMWATFPLVRKYLKGVAASSPHEAQLGAEEFGGEVHAYAPAYSDAELAEIIRYADHISFNSVSQWNRFKPVVAAQPKSIGCALRVNPEHSEVEVALYDPCAPGSRLGVTCDQLEGANLDGLTGLHFHTLCEKDSDALERTLPVVEAKFAAYLERVSWVNFGGGHHITRPGYDVDRLCRIIDGFRARHAVEVYLEPGEAIALNTGVLVASVLDIVHNRGDIAILDTSATAHMPDVLEMPYRPKIEGAGAPGEFAYTYRLGGLTCLAGDVIGEYSFSEPLRVGSKLVFGDMAHYTMVKNTTFNGVRLPSIATYHPGAGLRVVREFGYEDYKSRLS
ncbi:MAG: carboxynorspermidine decarboxylase [Candidatus Hydrogenedentes bacterium]|nr:carboxynorspermidine decarboxylase [Candidatus Hydrogenedentota bacterium]